MTTTPTPAPAPAQTLAEEIAEEIRALIRSGRHNPGDPLPTEKELAAQWRVSRGTARSAYQLLIDEGLVVAQRSRGHFVRSGARWTPIMWRASDPENNLSTDDGPQDTWARCVREQGREPAEDIRIEIVEADDKARQHLQLAGPVPLIVRRRSRFVDGAPSATADSFYLREHVQGTAVELPSQVYPGVYAVFDERGLPWIRTVDEVSARMPTREEARRLGIVGAVPVLEVVRVSYTDQQLPVRMTVFLKPGDRYKAVFEHGGESPR
ncbi:GntR family transcriptional regulator [Micromonospora sp. RP3T]|uniref:GntR family transcriptional regulator n=1 Tax=Micromonospora sp. RP3T TaxID=2135446 RepID=UPI003D716F7B